MPTKMLRIHHSRHLDNTGKGRLIGHIGNIVRRNAFFQQYGGTDHAQVFDILELFLFFLSQSFAQVAATMEGTVKMTSSKGKALPS
jgi:hypothetical protein